MRMLQGVLLSDLLGRPKRKDDDGQIPTRSAHVVDGNDQEHCHRRRMRVDYCEPLQTQRIAALPLGAADAAVHVVREIHAGLGPNAELTGDPLAGRPVE